MSGLPLGTILPGVLGGLGQPAARVAAPHRTGAPIRRRSYQEGRKEATIWRPIGDGTKRGARRFIGAYLRAAEKFDFDNKQPGKANGPLGHVALQVLRVMLRVVDYKTGRLDPSIETLQRWTRRSRGAVVAALARLKEHKFLDWIRRTAPVDNPDPFGPQVKQITNAYGLVLDKLPAAIHALLARMMGKPSTPADHGAHETERRAQEDYWLKALPLGELGSELMRARGGDQTLAQILDRLGARLDLSNASLPDGQNPETEV